MHGIQALTMIPDPRRRCGRHSPRFSLLAIVLIAAMHPQPPRKRGLKGGDAQADGQLLPFHRTHEPLRRDHDHRRIVRPGGWDDAHAHATAPAAAAPAPRPAPWPAPLVPFARGGGVGGGGVPAWRGTPPAPAPARATAGIARASALADAWDTGIAAPAHPINTADPPAASAPPVVSPLACGVTIIIISTDQV